MSHVVDIPGGTATLLDANEMTPRRIRAVEVIQFQSPTLVEKLNRTSSAVLPNGEVAVAGDDATAESAVTLTEAEANLLLKIQDATIYAQLASWTLDIPRPETVDAVQDIPLDVYQALKAAIQAARTTPETDPDSFEPNDVTVADDASPFPSAGSSNEGLPPETTAPSPEPPATV